MSKPKANKDSKQQKYKDLKSLLNIDETLTKGPNKQTKKYNKVKNNIPLVEDYNFQADLLFLPTTKKGFKYIFAVVDLASDEFDIEPVINKEPQTIVKAFQTMVKRKHINFPYASVRTDAGNEFQGSFNKMLIDKDVLHKVSLPGRHRQTANIERLNRELGKLLVGYMNTKEVETGKPYREWTDIIDKVRESLNKIRKQKLPKNKPYNYVEFDPKSKPKFKVGDMINRMLDTPKNALNEKVSGTFREGDYRYNPVPEMIEQVVYFSGDVNYRYILKGIKGVSFAEWELQKNNEVEEEVDEIKAVLSRKYNRKEKTYYYQIWMYGETKAKAGWYKRSDLVKDIGLTSIKELDLIYEDLKKEQNKKAKMKEQNKKAKKK
jgi:hypothetical protein